MKKSAKKKTARKAAKKSAKKQKSFEETLWDTANKLRGSVESSEYKHVVLSLIFLKFVSDKFEERRAELVAEGKEDYLDMVEFYTMQNVFYLPETSRWSYIQQHAKQGDIALKIDSALTAVEKSNASLKGALPDNYFSRLGLDGSKLAALIDAINNIDTVEDKEEDTVGRVYEYFLGKFAASEGKLGGEFYTPKCVVNLIAEMIEPYRGKIYDPCCGSGGMFVQSIKFVESHHGNKKDISVYGQEFTATTYKLAKMNLAVRGLSANLGEVPADTFFKDQHPDLKADYIMANPPFNLKDWRAADELVHDGRWNGYDTPPTGNANYVWILHMVSKLSDWSERQREPGRVARRVSAAARIKTASRLRPRQRLHVHQHQGRRRDPPKARRERPRRLHDRPARPTLLHHPDPRLPLVPDQKQKGRQRTRLPQPRRRNPLHRCPQDRLHDQPDAEGTRRRRHRRHRPHLPRLAVQPDGQLEKKDGDYDDEAGYCKSATLEDIRKHDYVLTPGRFVGTAPLEDDGVPFETKMTEPSQTLYARI